MIDNNDTQKPEEYEAANAEVREQFEKMHSLEISKEKIDAMAAAQQSKQSEVLQTAKVVHLPVHKAIKNGVKQEQGKRRKGNGKSIRRQQKAQKRNNNGWDELNGIALACYRMLTIPSELQPLLRERKLLAKLKDLSLCRRLIDSVVRDTRALSTDFTRINKLHQGKAGHINTDEDLITSYSIFTDYVNFTELCNSCLVPTLAHLSEMLGEAMNELAKEDPELVEQLNNASINKQFNLAKNAMNELTGATDTTANKVQEETA